MTPELFQRVREIFDEVHALPQREQSAAALARCGNDRALAAEVMTLLNAAAPTMDGTAPVSATSPTIDTPPDSRPPARSAAASSNSNQSGTVARRATFVAGYRLIRKLGEGGMGTVYEAEQQSPRRPVALKIIRPGLASDSVLHRFEVEKEVLGRLEHSGIARIYGAGTHSSEAGTQPYFAMELVRGVTLTQWATDKRPSLRRRVELLVALCDAIQHAHQRGVIHRDLKPANILVDDEGRPKVLDFGVARVTASDLDVDLRETQSGQIIGTPQYMSPEQAAGDSRAIDTRSDVYALGLIGYELLTGRRAHDLKDKSLTESLRIIQEVEPARPSIISAELSGDLEVILLKALSKEKERRYSTAAELGADLRRYLGDEPIEARPATTLYQLRKFARRNRVLVAGVATAIALLVAGIVTTTWQATRANRQRDIADQQRQAATTAEAAARQAQALAERRLRDQREILAKSMFDVTESIETLEGSLKARLIVGRTNVDYLERLAADFPSDAGIRNDLSMALLKLADAQEAGHMTPDAIANQRRALELRRRRLADNPNDSAARWDVLLSLHRVLRLRALPESETADARRFVDAIIADPNSSALSVDVAKKSLTLMGLNSVAAVFPPAADVRTQIRTGLAAAGNARLAGDHAGALRLTDPAYALIRPILAKSPDDIEAWRWLGFASDGAAQSHLMLNQLPEAAAGVQEAIAARTRVMKSLQAVATDYRYQCDSLHLSASIKRRMGRQAEVAADLERATPEIESLRDALPAGMVAERTELLRSLIRTSNTKAEFEIENGNAPAGRTTINRSIEKLNEFLGSQSINLKDASILCDEVAAKLKSLQDTAEADRWRKKSAELRTRQK